MSCSTRPWRARHPRAAFLLHDCPLDDALRAEVQSLLSAHEQASSGFFEQCAFDATPRLPDGAAIAPGRRIGRYTLRGVLGRGGSGIVYEAEQDDPARIVALKVARSLPYLDEMTARVFRREGQALARLEHPGIAAIHEAGIEDDCHYFALERVIGAPLTEYANKRGLVVRDRLELFGRVCDAVHYAHQRGVIHRDLKPSNILVTAEGQPKVLDFGLARIVAPDAEFTRLTESGSFHGTLAYSSPEQVSGRADQIDVRSDIYSLGVILYELLSGQRPYEISALSLPQAARVICEQPARPLSSRGRDLRGDLETIVQKALQKEPDRRYVSAAALGDDIQRFLSRQPILAHPSSITYQFRKLVSRHKLPFAIAGAGLALILALTVWLAVLFVRARDSEHLAQVRAATANRVKEFMLQIFSASDPDSTKGENPLASELLARGVTRIENELRGEPLVQAELFNAIGNIYQRRGDYTNAISLHEKALDLRIRKLGERDVVTAITRTDLATALFDDRRLADAGQHFEKALNVLEEKLEPDDPIIASALAGHAQLVRNRDVTKAEQMQRRVLAIRRKHAGENDPEVGQALTNLGIVLRNQGRNAEAEECYRNALPILIAAYGENRVVVAHTYNSLGVALKMQQRLSEAEDAYLQAQRIYRKLWNNRHPLLASSIRSLAQLQREQGHFCDAEQSFRESLQMSRDLMGEENLEVAMTVGLLGIMLREEIGDAAAALPLARQELAICQKVLPRDHPHLAGAHLGLAEALSQLGQHEEAVAWTREGLKLALASRGAETPNVSEALRLLTILTRAGLFQEAEPQLQFLRSEATKCVDDKLGDWPLSAAEFWLGKCLSGLGRVVEAEELLLSAEARNATARASAATLTVRKQLLLERERVLILEALIEYYEAAGRTNEAHHWRAFLPASEATIARIRAEGARSSVGVAATEP